MTATLAAPKPFGKSATLPATLSTAKASLRPATLSTTGNTATRGWPHAGTSRAFCPARTRRRVVRYTVRGRFAFIICEHWVNHKITNQREGQYSHPRAHPDQELLVSCRLGNRLSRRRPALQICAAAHADHLSCRHRSVACGTGCAASRYGRCWRWNRSRGRSGGKGHTGNLRHRHPIRHAIRPAEVRWQNCAISQMRINLLNRVRAKPLTAAIDVHLHGRRVRPNGRRCNGKFAMPYPKTQPPRDRPVGLPAVMGLARPLLGFASWGRSFTVGFVAAVAFIGITLATG